MTEKEHDHELARVVMSKKAKRLYDRMKHGINKKKESADKLKEKRESLSKKGKNWYLIHKDEIGPPSQQYTKHQMENKAKRE